MRESWSPGPAELELRAGSGTGSRPHGADPGVRDPPTGRDSVCLSLRESVWESSAPLSCVSVCTRLPPALLHSVSGFPCLCSQVSVSPPPPYPCPFVNSEAPY